MNKTFDPKEFETELYEHWKKKGYFSAHVDRSKTPFTIMMPPPNITGQLHIGHALTMTVQDSIVRYKRMRGFETLWLPGTDHASIATEVKIVDKMAEEGLTKEQVGREEFLRRAFEWKDKYGGRIIEQLGRLDAAGITYTTFYIIGMGGRGAGKASGEATARMFNQVHPTRITTTGMTVFPHTPLAEMKTRHEFVEASEREKIEELQAFLKALTIDTFYDGIHYLNPLNYRFANNDAEAKRRVLEDIDDVLRSCTDNELEMMISRHLKHSL